jgi:MHS family proline/betaine transporter-like MFS transporter
MSNSKYKQKHHKPYSGNKSYKVKHHSNSSADSFKSISKIITSTTLGNSLEWFEYTLYAYFASVIGSNFFPATSSHISFLMTFCVFFVGFVARPFGGLVFGYIGDRVGRKSVLSASILLMAIPTGLIGILPSYQTIGIAAPLIMILLRILQGLSVGGEFSTSIVYLTESAPRGKRGFVGSFSIASVGIGFLMSIITVAIIEATFTKEQVHSYAWRIPFIACFSVGILGFYIRKHLPESNDYQKIQNKHLKQRHPLGQLFANHFINLILAVFIFAAGAVSIYTFGLFAKTMLSSVLSFSVFEANVMVILAMTAFVVAAFVSGYLADKINPLYLIIAGAFCVSFLTPFLLYNLSLLNFKISVTLYILLCSSIAFIQSPFAVFVVDLFPVNIRSTAVATVYSFISIFFAGTAPIIAMQIIKSTSSVVALGYYILPVCILTIISAVICNLRLKKSLLRYDD